LSIYLGVGLLGPMVILLAFEELQTVSIVAAPFNSYQQCRGIHSEINSTYKS
jgi:hypothetical protein